MQGKTDDGQGTGFIIDAEGNRVQLELTFWMQALLLTASTKQTQQEIKLELALATLSILKKLGYVIDPNGTVPYTTVDGTRVYHAGGLGVNSGREGLVEFATSEYEVAEFWKATALCSTHLNMTHIRELKHLNPDAPESIKERPNTQISATNYVTDPSTQEQYFFRIFLLLLKPNLPYLEFDPLRYEITISKTITDNTVDYSFS